MKAREDWMALVERMAYESKRSKDRYSLCAEPLPSVTDKCWAKRLEERGEKRAQRRRIGQ